MSPVLGPAPPSTIESRSRFAFLREDQEPASTRRDDRGRRRRLRRLAVAIVAVVVLGIAAVVVAVTQHDRAGGGHRSYTLTGTVQDRYAKNTSGFGVFPEPRMSPTSVVTVTDGTDRVLGVTTLGLPRTTRGRQPWIGRYTSDTYTFRIVGLPAVTSSSYYVSIDGVLWASYSYDDLVRADWRIRL